MSFAASEIISQYFSKYFISISVKTILQFFYLPKYLTQLLLQVKI